MRELIPYVIEGPRIQVRWEFAREISERERRLYLDAEESVAAFKAWKGEHPRDGTMTVLYRWSPYILAGIGISTMNPVMFVMGLAEALRRRA